MQGYQRKDKMIIFANERESIKNKFSVAEYGLDFFIIRKTNAKIYGLEKLMRILILQKVEPIENYSQ